MIGKWVRIGRRVIMSVKAFGLDGRSVIGQLTFSPHTSNAWSLMVTTIGL